MSTSRVNRIGCIVVLVALMGGVVPARGQIIQPEGKTKVLLDFEDAKIWSSENESPFEVRAERVSQGEKSLRVQFTNKPQWSNIWTNQVPGDWSGFRYLNFNVYLEGDEPGQFGMWVRHKQQSKAEMSWPLGPGWNTLTMDLDRMKRSAGLDRSAVTAICLYKETKEEITVHIDNLYLSENEPVPPKAEPVRMADKQLLSNGGFEELQKPDELGSPFAWWTAKRWSGASFMGKGEKGVYEGTSALMLDGRGACKIGVMSPPIKISSPTKLKLTAYVQGSELDGGRSQLSGVLSVTDASEKVLAGAEARTPEGTFAWKKLELTFDVPARTPVVKVFVQLCGPGRLWVDDVSLTGVDLAAKSGVTFSDTEKKLAVDPPIVTETPELLAKKQKALEAMAGLKAAVAQAKSKAIETKYAEIPLMLGELAFDVRWDLPDHLSLRAGYCDEVLRRCEAAKGLLEAVEAGKAPDLKVPAHPDFAKLHLQGPYYVDESGKPHILFSMQYHSNGPLLNWFSPEGYEGSIPAVGGTRYDFKQMPVWEVYQKNPETHRVYDNGWCGHIIRDQYSAGGEDRCVINLDHPEMRAAIAKSIEIYADRIKGRPNVKFVNLGFEYAYRNYDAYSLKAFRAFLQGKYQAIATLNGIWKTAYKSFEDVPLPPYADGQTTDNPAMYYDWGDFNLWRFTDYMNWACAQINKYLPGMPTTTGGGNPFGAGFWSDGIDEEALSDAGVSDIWLSETGSRALGVTSVMDLQRSLDPGKPIIDPEYHALPDTCFLMFLHGCGLMDYWWWPDNVNEFYESSMKHSPTRTLTGVAAVMQTALDVRRMPEEIAAFRKAPTQMALLYSRASLIQRYPAAAGSKTPYSIETEKSYSSAVRLDASVGFVSSKQARAGKLRDFKVVLISGARFVEADVYDKVRVFVEQGGTVVVTPTSLVADEYNRRRNYLDQLGLKIKSEELPEVIAGKAARGVDQPPGEMDFIQGPVVRTIVAKEPKRGLSATQAGKAFGLGAKLAGEGVLQTVEASAEWSALASYEGGNEPAILVRKLGRGEVYYLAAQLSMNDRRAFLDKLMEAKGFARPIRALMVDGGFPEDLESRTVAAEGGGYLTYVHNLSDKAQRVKLTSKQTIERIFSVSSGTVIEDPTMELAPYETRILKIELK